MQKRFLTNYSSTHEPFALNLLRCIGLGQLIKAVVCGIKRLKLKTIFYLLDNPLAPRPQTSQVQWSGKLMASY
jgi:hypothetical protein